MKRALPAIACAALGACTPAPRLGPPQIELPRAVEDNGLDKALSEAVAGVHDALLAALLRDHWAWALRDDPPMATTLGVHAYDDRLADRSPRAIAAARAQLREFLARSEALTGTIDRAGEKLDPGDALTLDLFHTMIEDAVKSEVCRFEQWNVDARQNPITEYDDLARIAPLKTAVERARLLSRYRQVPAAIDDAIANLRLGIARKAFATAGSVRRVIAMVDEQLHKPLADWPMMQAANKAEGVAPAERDAFRRELTAALPPIAAALGRYRALLADQILPHARSDDEPGISEVPDGAACYAARIHAYTTMALDPREVHELGMKEIARTDEELEDAGKSVLGQTSLGGTIRALRADKTLYFSSKEQILAAAKAALSAAKAAVSAHEGGNQAAPPRTFGRLPKTDCVVAQMPAQEEPFNTIAYYRPPHPDGSKPGEYVVNTLHPETRPRFEARVLAFHESIPGHHLQIAIAQELPSVPAFRKYALSLDAFVEGWALYAERLADEMRLYEEPLDRLGVASFDAWRAGRLVVDTGIHALGWSRELAEKFLLEHTALTPENIANEVDRYIAWPGQALAYKIGQREILALRRLAEEKLGAKFSLPAFHDAVLAAGALPLPVLRGRIEAWVRGQLAP